jgi:D-sedoheptulose 7-phosphate isomerase
MEQYFVNYLRSFRKALDSISAGTINEIFGHFKETVSSGKQIFVFGNGGSAMSSSHFTTDMLKGAGDAIGKPIKIMSLNDNMGLITAIGNDYSFEDVFVRQLKSFAVPGDLIFTLSVSGNSPNLVKAIEWAKVKKIKSVALVGGNKGRLTALADHSIIIDSLHYGQVEDMHMLICHMISFGFIENPEKILNTTNS